MDTEERRVAEDVDDCEGCRRTRVTSSSTRARLHFLHWMLQLMVLLLIAPGAAVSQYNPADLCGSPLIKGGKIFLQNVTEDIAVGTVIKNLQIIGKLGTQIALSVEDPNPYISFNTTTQDLVVVQQMDREAMFRINIKIDCEMLTEGNQLTIPIEVTIMITDVNDNPPVFVKPVYSTAFSEMTPVGTTVLTGISAVDADVENWKITFEIVEGPYSSHFFFPLATIGSLVLSKPLDYELVQNCQLVIRATDHHDTMSTGPQPQFHSNATVNVTISDGDDQNPIFKFAPYFATLEETSVMGSTVNVDPPITAYDPDTGVVSRIAYSIEQEYNDSKSDFFKIDSSSGQVTLQKDALERGWKFSLLIRAAKLANPNHFSTTLLSVWVQAANENAPRFLDKVYTSNLVENVPIGTYVTRVWAIDNDQDPKGSIQGYSSSPANKGPAEGTILTYSFSPKQVITNFAIDSRTGVVATIRVLSYESVPKFNLSVQVTDGKYFGYASVLVNLININNYNPEFEHKLYNFSGSKESGHFIGQVKAEDWDDNSKITYAFVDNSILFTIDQEGNIRTADISDDQLKESVYRLFVVARDDGRPPRQDAAVVTVNFAGETVGLVTGPSEQTNLVVIIVMAVLAGCLILIIIILCAYVYRKNRTLPKISPYTAKDIDSFFETSKSFEKGMNENTEEYTTYLSDRDSIRDASLKSGKDRHLAIYNDIPIRQDEPTTVQENPFNSDSGTLSQTNYSYARDMTTSRDSSGADHNSAPLPPRNYSQPGSGPGSIRRQMNGVNEILYDTAIAPMEHYPSRHPELLNSDSTVNAGSSGRSDVDGDDVPSYMDSTLSTFKVGSTQQLVAPHDRHDRSSSTLRGKGSSVSFVDDHQVNVYHPEDTADPLVARMSQDQPIKPEITVYY